ncbi:CGNR zinc finger domain-containing protein [Streptomyces sp. WM6386]|uniref:CGNR zinc finger domain-containing protein n=1 Tax=Streptomyces sp. WM6386 TaxID=1415558 RepID=UPI000D14B177
MQRVRVVQRGPLGPALVDRSPARNRRWCSTSRCGGCTGPASTSRALAGRSERTPAG